MQRRAAGRAPRVKGLVVELFARHRIFIPMARVRSIDGFQVVISGVVNTRRFERRESEMLVIDDLFDSVWNTTTFSRFASCTADDGGSSNHSSVYASSDAR